MDNGPTDVLVIVGKHAFWDKREHLRNKRGGKTQKREKNGLLLERMLTGILSLTMQFSFIFPCLAIHLDTNPPE